MPRRRGRLSGRAGEEGPGCRASHEAAHGHRGAPGGEKWGIFTPKWWLVGGLEHEWIMTFHSVGNVIIPTDSYFSEGFKPPTMVVVFDQKWGLKLGFTLEFVTAQKMLKGTFAKPKHFLRWIQCGFRFDKINPLTDWFCYTSFLLQNIYIYIFNDYKIPTLALLNSNGAAPPQNWASQNRPNLGQGCDCRGRRNQRWVPGGWEDSAEAVPICRRKNVATTSGFLTFYAVF